MNVPEKTGQSPARPTCQSMRRTFVCGGELTRLIGLTKVANAAPVISAGWHDTNRGTHTTCTTGFRHLRITFSS